MDNLNPKIKALAAVGLKLRLLTPEQVELIDDMLIKVGDYGEVHLIIQHGQLRYINKVESHKAWTDNKK